MEINFKYVIGSGWWASDGEANENPERKRFGDERIRSVSFFETWISAIQRTSAPEAVVVVDSAAPITPNLEAYSEVVWVSLPFNARHATDHLGRWCGWSRSVLTGAQYALMSDADYFVYVEQDCLLSGKGIIEKCIEEMRRPFMFGSGAGTPQPIQQSFFVIRSDRIPRFLRNYEEIQLSDKLLSPEWKFVIATWRPFVWVANMGLTRLGFVRRLMLATAERFLFQTLPFGHGRARPIDFKDRFFYFQHGTEDELTAYEEQIVRRQ